MRAVEPLVSVILPVRNGELYLKQALESLLQQSLKDFEIVAVDNGSVDRSPQILESYSILDSRLRIIRHETPGVASALNAGIAEARSDLVARMDADDLSDRRRLAVQFDRLSTDPRIAVLGTSANVIDGAGQSIGTIDPPADHAAIAATLRHSNCIIHPSTMMRRTAVEQLGGYRSAYEGCEDYDLWLRMGDSHRLGNLTERLLSYRMHSGQASYTSIQRRIYAEVAALRGADMRAAGSADLGCPTREFDSQSLEQAGLSKREISRAVAERAIAATRGALGFNNWLAAKAALEVAKQQSGIGWSLAVSRLRAQLRLAERSLFAPLELNRLVHRRRASPGQRPPTHTD